MLRVSPELVLLLAPSESPRSGHFAFSMTAAEFDAVWARLRSAGIPYGDSFDAVDNMKDPGRQPGARGDARALYFYDPSHHLIEIRTYEDA